jgi:hypothetical protein
MSEEFLQFIWEHRLYDAHNLISVNGERIEIINPGMRNTDSGPDFFNAMVRMEDTLWVGNVEIHKNASDWLRHHHQTDEAYDNTILHVVNHYDFSVKRTNGEEIPTVELVYPAHLLENYRHLLASAAWIPCQDRFHAIDPFLLKIGFNRLMVERLQEKTSEITARLEVNHNDWNETFYQFLARNFGFKINALPFELLAKSLPLGIIGKHADQPLSVEALLFGQSGLLHEALLGDDYFLYLREEYGFLLKKYNLRPIGGHLWKFLRLRPVNFPTVRIAQLAALLSQTNGLFSAIVETGELGKMMEIFDVRASSYWDTHYKFSYMSGVLVKHLGDSAIHNIIINTVVPFLFVYGEQNNKPYLKDRALEWLDKLPSEENAILKKWEELGVQPLSAFESQALLQLKNRYCNEKKCLKCHVGNKLVRQNAEIRDTV